MLKKLLLGLGTLTAAAIPAVTAVACGTSSSELDESVKHFQVLDPSQAPKRYTHDIIKMEGKVTLNDALLIARISRENAPTPKTYKLGFMFNGQFFDYFQSINSFLVHNDVMGTLGWDEIDPNYDDPMLKKDIDLTVLKQKLQQQNLVSPKDVMSFDEYDFWIVSNFLREDWLR